jgi:mono/diheme cytochrome c family protein
MKRFFLTFAFVATIATVVFVQNRADAQGRPQIVGGPEAHRKMLNTYCLGCHNSKIKVGGLALDGLNLQSPVANAETWEKALKKLRGRLMPPPGSPQPSQADIDGFSAWMETTLDTTAKGRKAGFVPIQRLNRTEYASAVKALIGVDVNEKDILPQDVQVEGFDNVAEALTTSPAFLDQYITAARQSAKAGVGDMRPPISSWSFKTAGNQDPELPFPPGIREGTTFTHNFPADGEYRFSIFFSERTLGLYNSGLQNRATQVLLLDGKVVFKGNIGGAEDLHLANVKGTDGWATVLERFAKIPVKVTAGQHTIMVGFMERSRVESDENVGRAGGVPLPNLADPKNNAIEIKGPYNPTGISHSKTRPLIFVCDPKTAGETPCARQIAESLAHRAYGRPVAESDLAYLMRFYNEGRLDNQPFDKGVEQIVAAVLASPDFLYRSIRGAKGAVKTSEFALTDLELARRLSYFIWNTPPDAELLKIAESNGLTKPGVVDAQVKRMLADPKAQSLVSGFAMKWLNLNTLDSVQPDAQIFNGFTPQLRRDFMREAELFLGSVLLENKSVVELLTSNQTFMNNRLSRHYGINNPALSTSAFKPVTLTDENRFGLLGKAAVLMRTSYGDRTSPVLRGAWVLDKLIGTPPAPPPPTVVANLDQKPGEAPKTVRARLEIHREAASCKQCHGVIDPTGLALENFDAIGRYRQNDAQANNAKIDASTVLPNGIAINGPVELRAQLASRPEDFVTAMTEKLMMYAVNRELKYFDMPQVRKVVHNAKKDNYTLASLVAGIVNADAFRKQGPATVTKVTGSAGKSSAAPAKPAATPAKENTAKATPIATR